MSQLDDFREQLRLAKGDDAARWAAASEPTHGPTQQKTMKKKKEPSVPDRTSISLSQQNFARLDSHKFWLRHHAGKDYPSYSALLDAMLDEVLEADEKAAAFVRRHGEAF